MKKVQKDLKKIKLVSRHPKVNVASVTGKEVRDDLPLEDPYKNFTPELNSVLDKIIETDYQQDSSYYFIIKVIRDMFYNIINCNKDDIEKMDLSLEVNSFIKEYKFDKNYHKKIKEDIKPLFYPILNGTSNVFKHYFGKPLVDIIDDVIEESPMSFDKYKKYILNELHNIINYRKSTVILLDKKTFDQLHDKFLEIKNNFTEEYVLGNSKFYTKDNFMLDPYDILEKDVTYKVVYIIPSKTYGNVEFKLSKNNPRGIMAPVIFNKEGIPATLKLWNSVAVINKKYNLNIPVKCLVPVGTFIENNKVIKLNNKVFINCFNSLSVFKEKLNRKISLLLFSLTETYYNRRYL